MRRLVLAVVGAGCLSGTALAEPVTVRDAFNREVTLRAPPQRIVPIFASNVEMVAALGLADHIVGIEAYTRYPPEGVRGVAGTHRGSRYGTVSNYLKRASEEICVIVQIETLPALGKLDEIAAVPGIDSIFIGPSDLSASMGHLGDITNSAVQEHLAAAAKACRRAGKPSGIIGPTPEMVARFIDYGYSWVAIGSDMGFMVGRAQELLSRFRNAGTAADKPVAR